MKNCTLTPNTFKDFKVSIWPRGKARVTPKTAKYEKEKRRAGGGRRAP